MQKFLSLGAECVKIWETANVSQGFFHCACDFYFHLTCLQPYFYMVLMSFPFLAASLITARAHILALEVEVKASAQAWENANVAKDSAEKAAKSAENRAKKAKKALADADQK
jgi:hypothetical protein